jgi:hypothetical protein
MTTAALKKKIKVLVDAKKDRRSLQRVHDQLNDPHLEAADELALTERLEKAEADFKAGRVMGAEEARKRLKVSLKRFRAAETRTSKRA